VFRNQSEPAGAYAYAAMSQSLNSILPPAHEGTLFLGVTDAAAGGYADELSAWAILPPVSGQQAGDLLTVAVFTHTSSSGLEIRYAPGGGTATGFGAAGVGDFTSMLGTIGTATDSWVQHQFTIPGTGRLALRYLGQRAAFNSFHDFVGVDSISVGVPPSICNMPPLPAPAQTVHWTRAGGPYQICQSLSIPAGSTVVVEAGAAIRADAGRTVAVQGTLRMQGSAASPVVMTSASNYQPMIEVAGTLEMAFARIGGQVRPLAGGTLLVSDSVFEGPNGLVFGDPSPGTGFGRFERVTFTDGEFTIGNYTLVLRDITLLRSTCRWMRGYPFVSNIRADGDGILVEAGRQGTYLDTVDVRNAANAGLMLASGNFLIGREVTLSNNAWPAQVSSAGILPGSVLPSTGNISNMIYVPGGDHSAPSTLWADAGVPYYIASLYAQYGGSLKILEGVRVKLAPGASMKVDAGHVAAFGTEERPIFFEPALPGEEWFPLTLFYRFRHAVLDGATRCAAWPGNFGFGFMDSSIVRNCSQYGVIGAGIIRKTLFQNNGTGAHVGFNLLDLDGETNPNAFEGNGTGVTAAGNARHNWWGSPSGPTSQDNPRGTGDAIAAGIPFQPFLTARPDFADAPPLVDLERHSFLARPGRRVILTWKARDDGSIVSQRVLLAPDGHVTYPYDEPIIVADGLPGSRRSVEFVMPEPASRFFGSANIRVEATDDAGQVGWDDLVVYAERDEPGELALTSPLLGSVKAGENLGPVCWEPRDISPIGGMVSASLLLENTGESIPLGGVTTYLSCLSGELIAPFVSTDRARIVLSLFTGGGVSQPEYYFGPAFSIRPDPRVEDAPPAVTMTSPAPGAPVAGGTSTPIRWIASDDLGLRAVHIQTSLDGGRTWGFIARNLDPASGSYDWSVPPSGGERNVRIKVVAVDTRFQDSSDGAQVPPLPGRITGLHFTDAGTLSWDGDAVAGAYDVLRGDADLLHGNASVGDAVCLSDDWHATTLSDSDLPGPGRIFYYLVRGDTASGPAGTYNDCISPYETRDTQAGTAGGTDCGR
jgi:hypothetical protein